MSALLFSLGLCLATFVGLAVARHSVAKKWRTGLTAFKLGLPDELSTENVAGWLATVTTQIESARFSPLPASPVVVEVTATKAGIGHYLVFCSRQRRIVLSSLRAALPIRLEEAADYLRQRPQFHVAAELRLRGSRLLAHERGRAASAAYLAAMQPLYADERVTVQLVAAGTATRSAPIVNGQTSDDSKAAQARLKQPLLHLTVRVGAAAERRDRAGSLLHGVLAGIRLLNAPGAKLIQGWLPSRFVGVRLLGRSVPIWSRLTINVVEAAGLFGMAPGVHLPGLQVGGARQLPPPPSMARAGCVVATSNYPGTNRPLALRIRDRLAHTYIDGPTGVGKSALMVNMALQDIAARRGVVFIDPKGDAVQDVLARVPVERQEDVVVINPAAVSDYVTGWNVLNMPGSELARELAVDFTVNTLHDLWRGSWGPRTADVLRASLLTLTHTRAADGSAFAITDVPELLTNDHFRRFVLGQTTVPPSVRGFWGEYDGRADADRLAVIGPAMNKLRAFNTRTALRLALGQSRGFDLQEIFTKRRILLVAGGKGAVGPETAALLCSFVVSGVWQSCLRRVDLAPERRHPVMCYIDEAQDVARLPTSLEDMLAQARGLGMGLVIANQSLAQLPDTVQSAVLGVIRTQVAFQTGHKDAKILAQSFGPLTARELQALAAHEVAVRACVNGQTLRPVTGTTLALPAPLHEAGALAAASRRRYGSARLDVEAAMLSRITPPNSGPIGRQRRGVVA